MNTSGAWATNDCFRKNMDSLTQLTLVAACGEAVLGKQVGRKALVWGAVLGTLPDLDVFIPLGGPVNDFVYHRSFSHSLLLLAFFSAWPILPGRFALEKLSKAG